MKIYLDLVVILNFCYDFLILMTVDITLKRHVKLYRLFLGGLLGSISIFVLFLPLNEFILFLIKILVSIFMVLITFKYKDLKYTFSNLFYLYMCSVTLGGFLYFLNVEFSYKQEGLVFYFEGLSINYILLLIVAPFILYLYIKEHKRMKSTYNFNYDVRIVFKDNQIFNCKGYLDTGNKLKDPITKKYIILVSKECLNKYVRNKSPIYVPFRALNKKGLIECFSIKSLIINNQAFNNYMVGLAGEEFHLEGIDCLLNNKLMEELCLEN